MADQMPELMVGLEFLRTLHNAGFEGPPAVLPAPPPVAPFVCSFPPNFPLPPCPLHLYRRAPHPDGGVVASPASDRVVGLGHHEIAPSSSCCLCAIRSPCAG